jgi:hypothetical protein
LWAGLKKDGMGRDVPALNASKKFRAQNSFGKDTYAGGVSFSGLAHRMDDWPICGDSADTQIRLICGVLLKVCGLGTNSG